MNLLEEYSQIVLDAIDARQLKIIQEQSKLILINNGFKSICNKTFYDLSSDIKIEIHPTFIALNNIIYLRPRVWLSKLNIKLDDDTLEKFIYELT